MEFNPTLKQFNFYLKKKKKKGRDVKFTSLIKTEVIKCKCLRSFVIQAFPSTTKTSSSN